MYPLIILAGPTASGKSETALELAEHFNTEIISADSVQVYKLFNIGTAKPAPKILRKRRHHLIDILEPEDEFNAFKFKTLALKRAREIAGRNKVPLVSGGTGLYIKTLMEGLDCATIVSSEIRKNVRTEISQKGSAAIHSILTRIDPSYAQKISPSDSFRVERAYSVYLQTGQAFSTFHDKEENKEFKPYVFVLDWDRKELYKNIEQRIDLMFSIGWVEEVADLLEQGYTPNLKPFQGIGYSQIAAHLENKIPLEETKAEIKKETRRYAKRQLTWLRKTPGAKWIPVKPIDSPKVIKNRILSHLSILTVRILVFFIGIFPINSAHSTSLFEQGTELFRKGNYSQAENFFFTASKKNKGSNLSKTLYLLGLSRKEQNKFAEAEDAFRLALKSYPEFKDYILYRLAECDFEQRQFLEANNTLESLLHSFPGSRFQTEAEWMYAKTFEILGHSNKAISTLANAVLRGPANHKLIPIMIYQLGRLQEDAESFFLAYQAYQKLYIKYPTHPSTDKAIKGMKRLDNLENFKSPLMMGKDYLERIRNLLNQTKFEQVIQEIEILDKKESLTEAQFFLYKASALLAIGKRKSADKNWRSFLKRFPLHPQKHNIQFKVARNLWNLDRNKEAAELFKNIAKNKNNSHLSPKARHFLGRVYQTSGKLDEAIAEFEILITQFSKNKYAQEARWRIGFLRYLQKDFVVAEKRFQANYKQFPTGLLAEANLYWRGKALERLGQTGLAEKIYMDLNARFPYRYYGIRALSRLHIKTNTHPFSSNNAQSIPFASAKKLSAPTTPTLNRKAQENLRRAEDMLEMQLQENALYELKILESRIPKNLSGTIWLASLYNRAKKYNEAYRIMELYQKYKTKKWEKGLPSRFWSLYYPQAYNEIVIQYSRKNKIDPLWVRSIIRQESLFNSLSLSGAGARGLMQIMPKTGEKMLETSTSSELGPNILFDPQLNVRLGTKYLGKLNKRYNGNWIHILICYNAGPKALKNWLKRFETVYDSDVFIELIPFPETRKYVKLVSRNYGIYKMLYPEDVLPEIR